MRKKIEFVWERLDENTGRAKVYGGWIVTITMSDAKKATSSSVFVSDPEHGWVIIPPTMPPKIGEKEALDV